MHLDFDFQNLFFYMHLKFYNTSYVYILRYFLITLQTIQTLQGQDHKEQKDNDYPVAINIKTCE